MIGGIFSVTRNIMNVVTFTRGAVEGARHEFERLCNERESEIEHMSNKDVKILGVRPRVYESEKVVYMDK